MNALQRCFRPVFLTLEMNQSWEVTSDFLPSPDCSLHYVPTLLVGDLKQSLRGECSGVSPSSPLYVYAGGSAVKPPRLCGDSTSPQMRRTECVQRNWETRLHHSTCCYMVHFPFGNTWRPQYETEKSECRLSRLLIALARFHRSHKKWLIVYLPHWSKTE